MSTEPKEKEYYACRNCGFSPTNRADWCDKGCGRDYNEMVKLGGLDIFISQVAKEALNGYIRLGDVSAWANYGKECGYWDYFSKEVAKEAEDRERNRVWNILENAKVHADIMRKLYSPPEYGDSDTQS